MSLENEQLDDTEDVDLDPYKSCSSAAELSHASMVNFTTTGCHIALPGCDNTLINNTFHGDVNIVAVQHCDKEANVDLGRDDESGLASGGSSSDSHTTSRTWAAAPPVMRKLEKKPVELLQKSLWKVVGMQLATGVPCFPLEGGSEECTCTLIPEVGSCGSTVPVQVHCDLLSESDSYQVVFQWESNGYPFTKIIEGNVVRHQEDIVLCSEVRIPKDVMHVGPVRVHLRPKRLDGKKHNQMFFAFTKMNYSLQMNKRIKKSDDRDDDSEGPGPGPETGGKDRPSVESKATSSSSRNSSNVDQESNYGSAQSGARHDACYLTADMQRYLTAEYLAYMLLKEEGVAVLTSTTGSTADSCELVESARCRISSIYGLPKCPSTLGRLFADDLVALSSDAFCQHPGCIDDFTSYIETNSTLPNVEASSSDASMNDGAESSTPPSFVQTEEQAETDLPLSLATESKEVSQDSRDTQINIENVCDTVTNVYNRVKDPSSTDDNGIISGESSTSSQTLNREPEVELMFRQEERHDGPCVIIPTSQNLSQYLSMPRTTSGLGLFKSERCTDGVTPDGTNCGMQHIIQRVLTQILLKWLMKQLTTVWNNPKSCILAALYCILILVSSLNYDAVPVPQYSPSCWDILNEEEISCKLEDFLSKNYLLDDLVERGLLSSTNRRYLANVTQQCGRKDKVMRLLETLKKDNDTYPEFVNSLWTNGYWQLAEAVCQRCEQCIFDRDTSRMDVSQQLGDETNSLEPHETYNSKVIDCGNLTVSDGYITPITATKTVYNSTARLTCSRGHKLIGPSTTTCLSDRTWSYLGKCEIIDCGPLTVDGVDVDTDNTTFGSAAKFACKLGYEHTGQSESICTDKGTWTDPFPTCTVIDCGNLTVSDGYITPITATKTVYDSTARLTCSRGHKLIGPSTTTCLSNRTWSYLGKCEIIDCGPLTVDGVEVVTDNTTFGGVAKFACKLGYELIGKSESICTDKETWTDPFPTCTIIDCGNLTVSDGYITPITATKTVYNSIALLTCNRGHEPTGPLTTTCLSNKTWSYLGKCKTVDCRTPSPVHNGKISADKTVYNSMALLECDYGYEPNGPTIAFCQPDATWSNLGECHLARLLYVIFMFVVLSGAFLYVVICQCFIKPPSNKISRFDQPNNRMILPSSDQSSNGIFMYKCEWTGDRKRTEKIASHGDNSGSYYYYSCHTEKKSANGLLDKARRLYRYLKQ